MAADWAYTDSERATLAELEALQRMLWDCPIPTGGLTLGQRGCVHDIGIAVCEAIDAINRTACTRTRPPKTTEG